MIPLFGMPGGPELLIILVLVVLLFGANKLPELARASGQAMGEFRRGREDIEREIRTTVSTSEPTSDGSGTETEPTASTESDVAY